MQVLNNLMYNQYMSRKRFCLIVILLILVFLSSYSNSFAHHTAAVFESSSQLGFFGKLSLVRQIGFVKTLKVIMTPAEKKDEAYHFAVYDLYCPPPNYWAVPEANSIYCQSAAVQIKCGETCPIERRTGAVCPEGHYCCRPSTTPDRHTTPTGTNPTPFSNFGCPGSASSIQFCGLQF